MSIAPAAAAPIALAVLPCSLCLNGDVIALPQKEIVIKGFEFINDCRSLADFVPLLQQESEECALLQSIGTLCGCPKRGDACNLCSDGAKAQYGWREMDFLSESFFGGTLVPTCEIIEAGLHSYGTTDSYCNLSQKFLREYCGCGAEPGSQPILLNDSDKCRLCIQGEEVPFPDKMIGIVGFPFQTCGQLANATETLFEWSFVDSPEGLIDNNCHLLTQLGVHCGCETYQSEPCPICKIDNAYEVPFPERRLDTSLTQFFMGDLELSCGVVADIAMLYSANHPLSQAICRALQGLGTQCGCTLPKEPSCQVCPNSLPEKSFDMTISTVEPYSRITCGMSSVAAMFLQDGDPIPLGFDGEWIDFECRLLQYGGFVCGCNDGLFTYWGAETAGMQKAAVWTQRVTAVLSLFGSIAIIVDIFAAKKKRLRKLYYQIMLGLCLSDVLSSIAWGLGPLPTNSDLLSAAGVDASIFTEDIRTGFYESMGNDATCKIQGFMLHWGFTSILYNVALSYFFKLSVVNGWTDVHFTTFYRVLMLGVPAVVGTSVAIAAIPFVTFTPVACTIGSYSEAGGWAKVIGLFYLPYGPAFLYAPINTCYISWAVRTQSRKSERWRFPADGANEADFQMENTPNSTGHNDQPTTRPRLKRRGSLTSIARMNLQRESAIEKLVFWQSCWYVVAFFASYSIFLVTFSLDGWTVDSYWFYMLLSILTPMQGFFNGFVYFRSRMMTWVVCWRKKNGRNRRSGSSSSGGRIQQVVAALLAKCKRGDHSSGGDARELSMVLEESYFRSSSSDQPIEMLDDIRASSREALSYFEKEDKEEDGIAILSSYQQQTAVGSENDRAMNTDSLSHAERELSQDEKNDAE